MNTTQRAQPVPADFRRHLASCAPNDAARDRAVSMDYTSWRVQGRRPRERVDLETRVMDILTREFKSGEVCPSVRRQDVPLPAPGGRCGGPPHGGEPMKALIRQAALWWLAVATVFVFLYGLVELTLRFPPQEHRLAYALVCLVSLLSVVWWIEMGQTGAELER